MTNPIGAHFSIKNGYLGAIKEALSVGAEAMQIFAKSPASAKLRSVTIEESEEISSFEERKKMRSIIIHTSYLINLAEKELDERSYQIKSITEDIKNLEKLGGDAIVIHCGKRLGLKKEEAIQNYTKNIKLILKLTEGSSSKILIENTAGQGTEMGFKIEEIFEIYKQFINTERIKICIDTAHAFGAGYDISCLEGVEKFLKEIEETIGINNIACIHLNDSKKTVGSRVDRHEDIGFGEIGENGLTYFIKKINKINHGLTIILETPQDKENYSEQIKKVKGWIR